MQHFPQSAAAVTPPPPVSTEPATGPTEAAAAVAAALAQRMQRARWPDGPACPRCSLTPVAPLGGALPLFYCRGCARRFSLLTGSALERSHLPLAVWYAAFQLAAHVGFVPSTRRFMEHLQIGSHRSARRLRQGVLDFFPVIYYAALTGAKDGGLQALRAALRAPRLPQR